MNLSSITSKMSLNASKVGAKLKKHTPQILMAAGIVGTVATTVVACKATLKINDILDESKDQISKINDYVEENGYSEKYSEEDRKKDLAIVYVKTGAKISKLYAPAAAIGILSLACIFGSYNLLNKRYAAAAAAYALVDSSFKDYRKRVIERFGDEIDKELKYNITKEEIEETITDSKGKEKVVKKKIEVANDISEYARFFERDNPNWDKEPEYNLIFLRAQQQYANDLLRSKGYLFLNDVYDMLGIPRSKAGQLVGWIYDPVNNKHGDNYVDFGIYDTHKQANIDFVNGYESVILLDFNVDGNILNRF